MITRDEDKHQPESESIQNQKSLLTRYVIDHGWDIYSIFCDEDFSGVDSDRPDFNRMIEAAKQKKFQIILCKSQSRFTRDMELVEKYIHGTAKAFKTYEICAAKYEASNISIN